MPRYVTSTRSNARYAHIGTLASTACGVFFADPFKVKQTNAVPSNRIVCPRCLVSIITPEERLDAIHLDVPVESLQSVQLRKRDAAIIRVLVSGGGNWQVARALGMSQRATVRAITGAMERADARTRFEWGYKVGVDAGRAAERADALQREALQRHAATTPVPPGSDSRPPEPTQGGGRHMPSLTVPDELLARLQAEADRRGVPMMELLARAVDDFRRTTDT